MAPTEQEAIRLDWKAKFLGRSIPPALLSLRIDKGRLMLPAGQLPTRKHTAAPLCSTLNS